MATSRMSDAIQHFCRTVIQHDKAGLTDAQLLASFVEHRDEDAFAALVRRHGPMVWGVCRRLLDHHDAQDGFQATFIVLVHKAASVVPREAVANWLYGVARQIALEARRRAARRRARERQVPGMTEPAVADGGIWNHMLPMLDQELGRLPDKYRGLIVLCDLEGKTIRQAARQFGCPEGTVASRLARGRVMLAKRLARHGLQLSGGALATLLARNVASTTVPISEVSSTIKSASLVLAGNAAGAISVEVAALTEGALKAMLLAKLKSVIAVLVGVAMLGFGAGWIGYGTATGQQSESKKSAAVVVNEVDPDGSFAVENGKINIIGNKVAPQKEAAKSNEALLSQKVQEAYWLLTEVDAAKDTISVMSPPRGDSAFQLFKGTRIQPEAGVSLKGLSVDKKAVIQLDGKNVKLSELKDGMLLSLQMPKDSLTIIGIFAISADPHRYQYTVKAVDAVHNTITVTIGKEGPTLAGVPVAKDAKIEALEIDGTNKTDVAQAVKLSDLKAGTPVRLEMALDGGKLLVKAIQVGGD
jgi:RNA polymerase sigma factor (sigma-70 family)